MGFYLFDCSEYLVHHLGDDGVAVGFEGFGAPLSERKGKAVHIKGKPIISSVNRGDRREVLPAFSAAVCFFASSGFTPSNPPYSAIELRFAHLPDVLS